MSQPTIIERVLAIAESLASRGIEPTTGAIQSDPRAKGLTSGRIGTARHRLRFRRAWPKVDRPGRPATYPVEPANSRGRSINERVLAVARMLVEAEISPTDRRIVAAMTGSTRPTLNQVRNGRARLVKDGRWPGEVRERLPPAAKPEPIAETKAEREREYIGEFADDMRKSRQVLKRVRAMIPRKGARG